MKHVHLLLITGLLLSLQSSLADTTWVASGNVSGVWNSSESPYIIHSGDITVATSETLLINPGVKVYFAGKFKLIVNGLLQAIGTESDSIRFTGEAVQFFPADSPLRWRGIEFVNADEGCRLSYCSITYAGAADPGAGSYGGGVFCFNTDLHVDHSLITRCHCGVWGTAGRGCGMYIEEGSVILEFTSIIDNYPTDSDNSYYYGQHGTGLNVTNADAHLRHCTFKKNRAAGRGGAIYIEGGAAVVLDTCLVDSNSFYENTVAIFADTLTTLTLTGTTISNNSKFAIGMTGGLYCKGGALAMEACTLRANEAGWINPDGSDGGGGLFIRNPASATISNSVFEENDAQYGGAILCNNTTITNCEFRDNISTNGCIFSNGGNRITDCRFIGNEAKLNIGGLSYYGDGWGGAIAFEKGTSDTIENCLFEENTATYFDQESDIKVCHKGGVLFCDTSAAPYFVNCVFVNNSLNQFESCGTGSVLYNSGGHPVFEYCTMENNPASGGSYYFPIGWSVNEVGGAVYSAGGSVTLKSCIMSNSTATTGIWFANGATGDIHHSDLFGITGGNFMGNAPVGLGVISTTNANGDACDEYYNIYLDPEYVDVVNGDLHLANTSSCIGAGDPFSTVGEDYEHNTRPMPAASLRDIGAYESEIAGSLAAVDDLVIQPDYATDDVLLYWTASAGAVSYEVYVGDAPEYMPGLFTLIGTTASTSYTDTDGLLAAAPQRTYVVRASVLP